MKQSNLIIIFVIIIILVGGGAFYGGMKLGQTSGRTAFGPGSFQRNGAAAGTQRVANSSFVNGEIISQDDKSITVKLNNGGSKIIFYSDTTEIGKMASGTLADLGIGTNVMASGKINADGSISASSIQIRPEGAAGGFRLPGEGRIINQSQIPSENPQQ